MRNPPRLTSTWPSLSWPARVVAPIAGHLSRPAIDAGNMVTANETVLGTLEAWDPLNFTFRMPEARLLQLWKSIRAGQIEESELAVRVMLSGGQDFSYEGRLESLHGPVNPQSGLIELRAIIANPDSELMPGLSGHVRLTTSRPYDALLVPSAALTSIEGKFRLTIVNDQDVIERRPVAIGMEEGDLLVIKEGLKPGEWVVIGTGTGLQPGSKIVRKPIKVEP